MFSLAIVVPRLPGTVTGIRSAVSLNKCTTFLRLAREAKL